MHRSPPQQGVGAVRQRAVELLQLPEHGAHLEDRVDPQVRPRAVRRTPGDLDLAPHEALVCHRELQLGRLGDDGCVGGDAAQRLLDAEAGVLLVGDRGDHHVTRQRESRGFPCGDQRSCDACLHVVGPAAVQSVSFDARRVRVDHALDVDGVDVPAEQEGATAPDAARADQHARTAGRLLNALGA